MTQRDFSIKICGVTNPSDAADVARAGADAIGLNFFRGSKRYVDREQAKAIVDATPADIVRVGVFVNASPVEILAIHRELALDWVQLHGDEAAEIMAQLAAVPVIKAFRWDGSGQGIEQFFASLNNDSSIGRVLIDSAVPGHYGGSGIAADWPSIRRWASRTSIRQPLILAGGLTHLNVATAISESGVSRVDTASGVELRPRQKDFALMSAFAAAAKTGATTIQHE